MKSLHKEDIIDILYGCAVLGTGGGGSLAEGLALMEEDFEKDRVLKLADINELPDDAIIASPYGCGAPSATDNAGGESSSAITALKGLAEYLGKDIAAVSSTELGGMNTAEALHAACLLGIPLADGDPAGRSVPELIQSSFYLCGKPIDPFAVSTKYGDVAVFHKVKDDFRAEELVRSMACVSGDEVSVCDHPMTMKEYRESIIEGAISYAWNIGKTLKKAKEQGTDPVKDIVDAFDGAMLFKGIVTDVPWECRDGFDYGEIFLDGIKEYDGEKYKIVFQNENMASYRNGQLDVTVPDLICMIDKDGEPMTNPDFKPGDEMNVFALPAPKIWTTEKGLEIFGPRHFGIDVDYVPFNKK